MIAGARSFCGWLSFRLIADIPFGTCLAALESWQLSGQDGGQRIGQSLLRGPIEHDQDSGTRRVRVRLARGPLRPLLWMRLDIDHWACSPPRTALELIPCRYIRPSADYYWAGHLLLDSLALSMARPCPPSHSLAAPCHKGNASNPLHATRKLPCTHRQDTWPNRQYGLC